MAVKIVTSFTIIPVVLPNKGSIITLNLSSGKKQCYLQHNLSFMENTC